MLWISAAAGVISVRCFVVVNGVQIVGSEILCDRCRSRFYSVVRIRFLERSELVSS